jgi:hypothetical protein
MGNDGSDEHFCSYDYSDCRNRNQCVVEHLKKLDVIPSSVREEIYFSFGTARWIARIVRDVSLNFEVVVQRKPKD